MRKFILTALAVLALAVALLYPPARAIANDQIDKAFKGALPTAAGQIACSSDVARAIWGNAGDDCGLATLASMSPETMAAYSDGLGAGISAAAKVGYHQAVNGGASIHFHGVKVAGGLGTGSGKSTVYDLYDESGTPASVCTFTVNECNTSGGSNDAAGTEYTPTCSGTIRAGDKIVVRVVSTTCTTSAGDVMINAGWR